MAGAVIGFALAAVMILATRSVPTEMQGSTGLLLGYGVACLIQSWHTASGSD